MTRDDIIRMAKEAGVYATTSMGITRYEALPDELTKFAQLVAAHERDACIDIVLHSVSGSMREDLNCYEAVEKIRART